MKPICAGHQHSYERSCPMYQSQCTSDGSGPTYFTLGACCWSHRILLPTLDKARLALAWKPLDLIPVPRGVWHTSRTGSTRADDSQPAAVVVMDARGSFRAGDMRDSLRRSRILPCSSCSTRTAPCTMRPSSCRGCSA